VTARLVFGVIAVALLAAARTVQALIGLDSRVFLNTSPSMQTGFYWLSPGAPVHRGDVVLACVPDKFGRWAQSVHLLRPGLCDGVVPVVKRVVAIAGDRVRIDARGVFVNGHYLAGSKPQAIYHGAPLPHVAFGERVLRPGEVQLAGDRRSDSWDGRYFGPTSRVLGRATRFFGVGG
jgi:conjugative transfer signal peptidase TraF